MALVNVTINGVQVQAENGALLIEVAKQNGIEIPAFCYYEGMSLQAACRMCLVEVEKAPKLMAGCTLPVAEGMVVRTESEPVVKARKTTLEFLLSNHPLDCPVCDKGGECELQDMTFKYGVGESRFTEVKQHVPEKQWSPVVFYDAPRCILCYRCVRVCNEGMGVGALGISYRGVNAEIIPSNGDHLECDECGSCIDICPVGSLTSGIYRYKTRPWEMEHVGTVCTHCSNGCKTTLGVRNNEIVRGNNRDKSGINGEFLCVKGRYAFDFTQHPERLQTPLVRNPAGELEEASWSRALKLVAEKFKALAGPDFGVIGSTRTTNEENYLLQKFARTALGTASIDHHRTGDVVTLIDALSGKTGQLATTEELYTTKAVLVVASDLSQQQPLLANKIRANVRHHKAAVYAVTPGPVREDKIARKSIRVPEADSLAGVEQLREALVKETELVIVFGDAIQGEKVRQLVAFGESLGIPVKYIALVDYANSRGALDMGVLPDLGPGYHAAAPGRSLQQMLDDPKLAALWVVGANPLKGGKTLAAANAFVVVQDLFLTETAQRADVVLPAASAYEKNGTVTNVCGQVQRLKRGIETVGSKADLAIIGLLARGMGVNLGKVDADAIFAEIAATVPGYNQLPMPVILTGGAVQTHPVNGGVPPSSVPGIIASARDTLFTTGSLTRYSKILNEVLEKPGALYS
jgi:NADH-quinone oxidoreductase subunit G